MLWLTGVDRYLAASRRALRVDGPRHHPAGRRLDPEPRGSGRGLPRRARCLPAGPDVGAVAGPGPTRPGPRPRRVLRAVDAAGARGLRRGASGPAGLSAHGAAGLLSPGRPGPRGALATTPGGSPARRVARRRGGARLGRSPWRACGVLHRRGPGERAEPGGGRAVAGPRGVRAPRPLPIPALEPHRGRAARARRGDRGLRGGRPAAVRPAGHRARDRARQPALVSLVPPRHVLPARVHDVPSPARRGVARVSGFAGARQHGGRDGTARAAPRGDPSARLGRRRVASRASPAGRARGSPPAVRPRTLRARGSVAGPSTTRATSWSPSRRSRASARRHGRAVVPRRPRPVGRPAARRRRAGHRHLPRRGEADRGRPGPAARRQLDPPPARTEPRDGRRVRDQPGRAGRGVHGAALERGARGAPRCRRAGPGRRQGARPGLLGGHGARRAPARGEGRPAAGSGLGRRARRRRARPSRVGRPLGDGGAAGGPVRDGRARGPSRPAAPGSAPPGSGWRCWRVPRLVSSSGSTRSGPAGGGRRSGERRSPARSSRRRSSSTSSSAAGSCRRPRPPRSKAGCSGRPRAWRTPGRWPCARQSRSSASGVPCWSAIIRRSRPSWSWASSWVARAGSAG